MFTPILKALVDCLTPQELARTRTYIPPGGDPPQALEFVCNDAWYTSIEAMLDHFGVTEENWREGAKQDPHFIASETPFFVGRAVAALAADTPKVDDSYMFQRLVSIDLGSGELETVWDMPGKASGPRFSHDGEWLACRAGIAARDPQSGSIFVIPTAGGYARNLTPDYEGTVEWLEGVSDEAYNVPPSN